ncbi:MAG TPA: carbohydrate kinase [Verrucomicrobiales bacterium]|nr:carbohydrate kinase [Verrucomicrobiales bacterium]
MGCLDFVERVELEMNSEKRIVGLGEILWDVFPDRRLFGGAPANFSAHAVALGATVSMVSAVGRDELGTRALEELRNRGIDTDTVAIKDSLTGTVNITLDTQGEATYIFASNAAWDHLNWSERHEALALKTDAVAFGSLGQRSRSPRECIRKFVESTPHDCLRIFDVNLRQDFYSKGLIHDSLYLANILKLNDEELEILFPARGNRNLYDRLKTLCADFDLNLVALTRGTEGAIIVNKQEISECRGVATEVKDTVGAGDAFTAVLAHGLLAGIPIDHINRHACRTAAFVCSQAGATPELPEELKKFLTDE